MPTVDLKDLLEALKDELLDITGEYVDSEEDDFYVESRAYLIARGGKNG